MTGQRLRPETRKHLSLKGLAPLLLLLGETGLIIASVLRVNQLKQHDRIGEMELHGLKHACIAQH